MKGTAFHEPEGSEERFDDVALGEAFRQRLGDAQTTRSFSAAREARLVSKVLGQTTREDLSWRGELSLFSDYVRERVATSPVLKLLAASLLAHLVVGGPLLAYWAYHAVAETKQPMITFELPEDPFAGAAEELALEEPLVVALDPEQLARDRSENALRVGRFQVSHARLEIHASAEDLAALPLEIGLLRARSSMFTERRWSLPTPVLSGSTSALAVVLSAELLLDRMLIEGQRPVELTRVLEAVATRKDGGSSTSKLAERVLKRAQAYGAWPAPEALTAGAPPVIDAAWCEWVVDALGAAGASGTRLELAD